MCQPGTTKWKDMIPVTEWGNWAQTLVTVLRLLWDFSHIKCSAYAPYIKSDALAIWLYLLKWKQLHDSDSLNQAP